MKKTAAVAASTALSLLFLPACSSQDDATPGGGGSSSADGGVEAPVDAVSVTLINPGSAPRDVAAYAAAPGEQKLTYILTQGLEQRTTGGPGVTPGPSTAPSAPPAAGPTSQLGDSPYGEVTMRLPLTATADTSGDTWSTTLVAGTPTGSNTERNEDVASANGFRVHTTSEINGKATSRRFSAPEGASTSARADVEEAFKRLTDVPVVFPTEPIGPGASWKVSGRVDAGVSMLQDVIYTLRERKGGVLTLSVDVRRRAAVATLPGTDLKVQDVRSSSEGSLTVDLSRALPTAGSVSVRTSITYGQDESATRVVQTTMTKTEYLPG